MFLMVRHHRAGWNFGLYLWFTWAWRCLKSQHGGWQLLLGIVIDWEHKPSLFSFPPLLDILLVSFFFSRKDWSNINNASFVGQDKHTHSGYQLSRNHHYPTLQNCPSMILYAAGLHAGCLAILWMYIFASTRIMV